jgi:PAS domain S-box-containing protein
MGKKILVVDNNPVMLKFMTNLLEKEEHQVVTAENGLAALDILTTFTPDIVFLDLVMPHIDGEKLCQIIRDMPKLKEVYIIILSATALEREIDISAFGANACIAKGPLNRMAQKVLLALEKSNQRSPAFLPDQIIGREDVFPRQITTELLSIKSHFEVILKSMAEGILEITPEGRIVYVNPAVISLINLPENKLLGSNFTDLFQETDRQRIKSYLAAMDIHPQTVNEEVSLIMMNSKQISLSLLPILDKEDQTIIIILNDLSERKRMEAQFLQAQKMEAIGTLAGGIAHDFNNLLMVIQGNASLMLLNVDPSHPDHEMLMSIVKQVQSGSKLTNQLLGYARKGRYEVKPIQVNQLVEETSKAFGRTRKEITIHRELANDLFPIEGDLGQIEQVLMNLFVNAADAMPQGGDIFLKTINIPYGDIRGKLYNPKPGDYVLLTVTDTGWAWIQKLLIVFVPFFTTKELSRGTGLGLASVYGIIKGHGGYVDVESEEGRGTTFKIYLPASNREIQKKIEVPDHMIKGTGTILLVDDEEMVLEVGERFLKVMGYQVLTARDGREAIEVYKKHRDTIDLVLLDIIMPNMKGGEVFDRLKEINPEVKVLLSSGYSIDGEASKILERGCSGFIQKPFDMNQLSQSIGALLKKNST